MPVFHEVCDCGLIQRHPDWKCLQTVDKWYVEQITCRYVEFFSLTATCLLFIGVWKNWGTHCIGSCTMYTASKSYFPSQRSGSTCMFLEHFHWISSDLWKLITIDVRRWVLKTFVFLYYMLNDKPRSASLFKHNLWCFSCCTMMARNLFQTQNQKFSCQMLIQEHLSLSFRTSILTVLSRQNKVIVLYFLSCLVFIYGCSWLKLWI
jgi:hypothetical protein